MPTDPVLTRLVAEAERVTAALHARRAELAGRLRCARHRLATAWHARPLDRWEVAAAKDQLGALERQMDHNSRDLGEARGHG